MTIDPNLFRTLVPIDALAPGHVHKLLEVMRVEEFPADHELFQQGATDDWTVYLLAGTVELVSRDGAKMGVTGGTDKARYALANLKPRQFTGRTRTPVQLVRIDSRLLDRLLTWGQVAVQTVPGYEVTEFEGDVDGAWVLCVLQNKALQKLPTANIQALLARMQAVPVTQGRRIIRQGDAGDYYYMIRQGRARVTRQAAPDAPEVMLAELGDGDAFGEEALLADAPRNASVSMLTDGVLMRLAKTDFVELLKEPLLRRVTPAQASDMRKAGAQLVDVRLESEYRNGAIRLSVNIPLYLLRLKIASLDPRRPYIVYCDTGARSAAAAFLLSQRGFDVYVLEGGLAELVHPAAATAAQAKQ